jgi:excisionase family DNA binding protein
MHLDDTEVQAIAEAIAPRLADILERRLSETPQWAMSISEAATWAQVSEDSIRHAIKVGRLPVVRVGHNVRIRRSDLFKR